MKGEVLVLNGVVRMSLTKRVRLEVLKEMREKKREREIREKKKRERRKSAEQIYDEKSFHIEGTPKGRSVPIIDENSTGLQVRKEEK